nr:unnamed protein product [Digitaria exilis]
MTLPTTTTLRLHPAAPLLIPGESRESYKVLGYDVPKGTWVLPGAVDYKGMNFEYIPFGAGRRICPGILFAQANMELVLASLLYHFDWKVEAGLEPTKLDMSEQMALTIKRKNDLRLYPIVRRLWRQPPPLLPHAPGTTTTEEADVLLRDHDSFLADIRGRLLQTHNYVKLYYDRHHHELEFAVGDWVSLRLLRRPQPSLENRPKETWSSLHGAVLYLQSDLRHALHCSSCCCSLAAASTISIIASLISLEVGEAIPRASSPWVGSDVSFLQVSSPFASPPGRPTHG